MSKPVDRPIERWRTGDPDEVVPDYPHPYQGSGMNFPDWCTLCGADWDDMDHELGQERII